MRVALNRDFGWDRISVRIAQENTPRTYAHMQPATFVETPRGTFVGEAFQLDESGAQEMMNELWRLGIRPTDNTGSTGHLRAVENHVTDLREIVNKLFLELACKNT